MSLHNHSFDLRSIINPETQQPFGEHYAGVFSIRRPTIKDNSDITVKFGAVTGKSGTSINPAAMMTNAVNQMWTFCMIEVIAKEKPDWFNPAELYEEDEAAVTAVQQEVDRWVETFRPKSAGNGGQQGSDQPQVLVQEQVPATTD